MAHHTEETRCNMGIGRREIKQERGKNLHHVSTCSAAWENWRKLGGNNGHITTRCGVEKTQWENSVCCNVPGQMLPRAQTNHATCVAKCCHVRSQMLQRGQTTVATCLAKCCNVPRQMLPRAQTNHATSRAKCCNVPRQIMQRGQTTVATCLAKCCNVPKSSTMSPLARPLGRIGVNLVGTMGTLQHVATWRKLSGKKRYFGQKMVKTRSHGGIGKNLVETLGMTP